MSASSNWIAEGNQAYSYFGYSVSTAGDVNGDGYSDVIIGAIVFDNGQNDEGAAFVFTDQLWDYHHFQTGARKIRYLHILVIQYPQQEM